MSVESETPLRVIQGGRSDGDDGFQDEEAYSLRQRDQVALPRLIAMRQGAESPDPVAGDEHSEEDARDASPPAGDAAADTSASTVSPQQSEFPFALVQGEPVTQIPDDLYIPPAALEVFLEAFEGPLDLLLYLIKRQNLDIMEIDVADLTEQYMQYVRLMDSMQFELAAEYLVMAAMLAEIKSRMLLPRSQDIDEDDEDPRSQLIRRLQEYERFKKAAVEIDEMPREERDIFVAEVRPPVDDRPRPEPDVSLKELLLALGEVLHRAEMFESHAVSFEPLSTRERMGDILNLLSVSESSNFVSFAAFFKPEEGRGGVVVTFLAMMELIKESLIEIVQAEPFAPIHIRARSQDANGESGYEGENGNEEESADSGDSLASDAALEENTMDA